MKLTILTFVCLTACVDEPVESTTESTTESTLLSACDDGWGDEGGFSDSEGDSGFGFEALAQPELSSAFGCDASWDDVGGNSSGLCSWPVKYNGSGMADGYGDEAWVRERARSLALRNARQLCMSSGWICTPQVDDFDIVDGGCVVTGEYGGEKLHQCSAKATVTCSYH